MPDCKALGCMEEGAKGISHRGLKYFIVLKLIFRPKNRVFKAKGSDRGKKGFLNQIKVIYEV